MPIISNANQIQQIVELIENRDSSIFVLFFNNEFEDFNYLALAYFLYKHSWVIDLIQNEKLDEKDIRNKKKNFIKNFYDLFFDHLINKSSLFNHQLDSKKKIKMSLKKIDYPLEEIKKVYFLEVSNLRRIKTLLDSMDKPKINSLYFKLVLT